METFTGFLRNLLDKFYTKPEIAKQCIEKLKQNVFIDIQDIIIEPSAGNGSFIPFIEKLKGIHLFYDILPEHPQIVSQDFLKLKIRCETCIHIIGNPPFGRQSSLAIKFIKKSCEMATSVSFILPRSFKKESLKRHFQSHFHCIFEWDLPKNSFLINEKEHDVPCVFQIWVKKAEMRQIVPKMEPIDFEFVKKNEAPDISFRRVGVNAGTISHEIENKSEQSHYFIKFKNKNLLEKFQNLHFDFENTVGPKSISKQELIKALS
jgi:hypothetical protein